MDLRDIIPDLEIEIQLTIFDEEVLNPIEETPKPIKQLTQKELLDSLSERQKMVYNYLKHTYIDGATAKELSVAMFKEGLVASPERNSVHPRLNELIHLNLIKVIGKKDCQYTGKKVRIYKNK